MTVSVPVTTSDHERRRVNCTIPGSCKNTQISVLGGQTFPFAVANRIGYGDLPVTIYPVILESESFPAAPVQSKHPGIMEMAKTGNKWGPLLFHSSGVQCLDNSPLTGSPISGQLRDPDRLFLGPVRIQRASLFCNCSHQIINPRPAIFIWSYKNQLPSLSPEPECRPPLFKCLCQSALPGHFLPILGHLGAQLKAPRRGRVVVH